MNHAMCRGPVLACVRASLLAAEWCSMSCLSIYSLMDTWLDSTSWLLWANLLSMCGCVLVKSTYLGWNCWVLTVVLP